MQFLPIIAQNIRDFMPMHTKSTLKQKVLSCQENVKSLAKGH
jgi:hypothetical protein